MPKQNCKFSRPISFHNADFLDRKHDSCDYIMSYENIILNVINFVTAWRYTCSLEIGNRTPSGASYSDIPNERGGRNEAKPTQRTKSANRLISCNEFKQTCEKFAWIRFGSSVCGVWNRGRLINAATDPIIRNIRSKKSHVANWNFFMRKIFFAANSL